MWDDASQQCVPSKPKPKPKQKCPAGQHRDPTTGQCVPNSTGVYTVWCRVEDQTTYLGSPNEPPEFPDDYALAEYDSLSDVPPEADWPQCEPEPEPPDITTPGAMPAGGEWCSATLDPATIGLVNSIPVQIGFLAPMIESLMNPEGPINVGNLYTDESLIPRSVKQLLTAIGVGIFQLAGAELQAATISTGCGSVPWLTSHAQSALVGFCERWVSDSLGELDIANQYARHLSCPQLTLDPQQATAAYLGNAIDQTTFYTMVQAGNQCIEPWKAYVESQRAKPNAEQLAQLRRREVLTEGDYNDGMRRLGYTEQGDVDDLFQLTTQIPFVSDILRMMVRDVADPQIVAAFGLDDFFTQKWQGQLKQWGAEQGIEDLYAQYAWRAHWSIPSPTALYEMLRRLRNTTPPPGFADWETAVKAALIQQDILPFWIEPLLALSYKPLTATDLVRSYTIGAIDENAVTEGYKQLGYNDDDAAGLTAYRRLERVDQARTLPLVKLYENDGVSRTQLADFLGQRNFPAADAALVVSAADVRKAAKTRTTCIASWKKRYMKGEIDANGLTAALIGLGLEPPEALNLTARYQCEFASRDPHLALRFLNSLYTKAIIGRAEYVRRAGNLGILPDLAGLVLQQLDADLGDQAAARQARALRKQQQAAMAAARAAARVAKAAQQAARAGAAAAARDAKAIAAANKAAAAARKTLDAAVKTAVKNGATEAEADATLRAAVIDLQATYGFSEVEAVNIATTATDLAKPWSVQAFNSALDETIQNHIKESKGQA